MPDRTDLFGNLPQRPIPLTPAEAALIAKLPSFQPLETVTAIAQEDEGACRALERRGLVRVRRWKDDPIAHRPTLYAGRLDELGHD